MITFLDTKTTGLPDMSKPSDHPCQPKIVQLAAILTDNSGLEMGKFSVIVRPDNYGKPGNYDIPAETSKIHGITTEIALKYGMPLFDALGLFVRFVDASNIVVAHNYKFDQKIIRTAMMSAGLDQDFIKSVEKSPFCTMEYASKIMKLPATKKMMEAGIDKCKPPKLSECYEHFFGEKLIGAHNALVDVEACKRLYFRLIANCNDQINGMDAK